MFQILKKSFRTGVVTTSYPRTPAEVSDRARGRPEIDFANWKDARPAVAVCPTGAISASDNHGTRCAALDLGKCIFCGLCAEADPAIRMTNQCELAARRSADLRGGATYKLKPDGSHERMISNDPDRAGEGADPSRAGRNPFHGSATLESAGEQATGQMVKERAQKLFGRSLHVRQVDAGSCNGCEIEIAGLAGPIYDAERFGIHFVASPRHADLLLVTGPVTRNMELALRKTYDAMPEPRLVVAVGACGCSGGIFGRNYATVGGVDAVIPVDVYIPGCPPNPHALLHGILLAIGRAASRLPV